MSDHHTAEAFGAWMQANITGTDYQEPHHDNRTPAEQFAEFMTTNLDQPTTITNQEDN